MIIEEVIKLIGNESDWRRFLLRNPQLIEKGFSIIQSEYTIHSPFSDYCGRIDIVGKDEDNNICLVEIKLFSSESNIPQVVGYYTTLVDKFSFFLNDMKAVKPIRIIVFGISDRHAPKDISEVSTRYGNVKIEFGSFSDKGERFKECITWELLSKRVFDLSEDDCRDTLKEKICEKCIENRAFNNFDRLCPKCKNIYLKENEKVLNYIFERIEKEGIQW